jgi:hypothetical protein
MKRREFLGLAAGLLFGGCQSAYHVRNMGNPDSSSEMERLVYEFPNFIPGAKRIEKYFFPDSRHTIVHIRQYHLDRGLKEDDLKRIEKVQYNILTILYNLYARYNFDAIYCEGVALRTEEIKNASAKLNYLVKHPDRTDIIDSEEFRRWIPWFQDAIKKYYEHKGSFYAEHREERLRMRYAAAYAFCSDVGKVSIRATELPEENDKAVSLARLSDSGPIGAILAMLMGEKHYIYDVREDHAVLVTSVIKVPYSFLIFGSSHDFYDNIVKWNKENPQWMASLIVITPEGIRD